jgi:hypothetical protein
MRATLCLKRSIVKWLWAWRSIGGHRVLTRLRGSSVLFSGPLRIPVALRHGISRAGRSVPRTSIDAFYLEHRLCGDLDDSSGATGVWMTCSCGAVLVRVVAFS